MINGPAYLLYLPEQQVLVCRSCQHCLQANGVGRHLQRKHQAIPLKIQKELVSYAESLTLRNPCEVVTPVTIIPAFEGLKVTPGFCCSVCGSLYGTIGSIEEHCTKAHAWTESKDTDHNELSNISGTQWKSQTIQTFFQSTDVKYFAVIDNNPPPSNSEKMKLLNLMQVEDARRVTQAELVSVV
jgi:hypothetical protein